MLLALFGIEDDGLNLVVNLLVLFLIVLYVALVAWTLLDARRRLEDPVLVACAVACGLFPFVGPIVYSILRPPEFLEDKRERELEIRASELRLRQLEEGSCPNCEHPIERTFLRCPSCRARVKEPCESCAMPIDPRWSVCPYCEMPARRAPAERRPAPKRRAKPPARDQAPPAARPASGGRDPASAQPTPRDGARAPSAPRPARSSRTQSSRGSAAPREPAPRAGTDE